MNYNGLQEEVKKRGVSISIVTLRRYVKVGLIPEPKRKHFGRGKGEQVEFPPEAIAEAVAANTVFREERFPAVELVKQARDLALEALKEKDAITALFANEQNLLPQDYKIRSLAAEWLKYYVLIRDGYDLNTPGYWGLSNGFRFVADGGKTRLSVDSLMNKLKNLTEEEKRQFNEKAKKDLEEYKREYKNKS